MWNAVEAFFLINLRFILFPPINIEERTVCLGDFKTNKKKKPETNNKTINLMIFH